MLSRKFLLTVFVFSFIFLTACGGNNSDHEQDGASGEAVFELAAEPTVEADLAQAVPTPPEIVAETAVTATETKNGPIDNLSDVRSATVRVAFEGSYLHYEEGAVTNFPNHGSGFIIDPSGIAVTNNHVVTGAAFLEVWLDGEDQPRNARVLGVSECSDLAVIDIDGADFPYLAWYDGPLNVGMDVYAAGFPLYGNTEYTLTRGIITKEQADGEMPWASVEHVIEIDAKIQGGNSGGPLVTPTGQVVAINYAGLEIYDQSFSIANDIAIPVVEHLRNSQDLHSIGVNGEAVSDGADFSGIWVSSVASGSPADLAGVLPGDIITRLEGLALATDGTFADYCDILRSRNSDDTMTIEVYRYLSDETWAGQLNGDLLELVSGPVSDVEPTRPATADSAPPDNTGGPPTTYGPYTSFHVVSDPTGLLSVEVPTVWNDIQFQDWISGEDTVGQIMLVSPDIAGLRGGFSTPGLIYGAALDTGQLPAQFLDGVSLAEHCVYDGRTPYDIDQYSGFSDTWRNCADSQNVFTVIALQDNARDALVFLQVNTVLDYDLEAYRHIRDSFAVK